MINKVLSIVIGTEITKVCEVSYNRYLNQTIRVYNSITFATPENTIEDGYIRDSYRFGEELKVQLIAANIKTKKVIFSITSSKVANREILIPPVRESKIMDIIRMGATEYFPIDIKDYILSYVILEKQEEVMRSEGQKDKKKKKKQIRLSVYAVPSLLVKNYYNFAEFMKFSIVSIDYSGNSSYQMIKRQVHQGTNVFVQLGEQSTLISILRDNVLILQRTVGYGMKSLTDAVMDQNQDRFHDELEILHLLQQHNLLTEQHEPNASPTWMDEAAVAKVINNEGNVNYQREQTLAESSRYVTASLRFLTNSIIRMLDYYRTNHKNEEFGTIFLSGIGIRVKGIEQFFTQEIGVTSKKLEKLATVSSKKKADSYRSNPSEFMDCIGAVIHPVDFIPQELVDKKNRISTIVGAVVIICISILGSFLLSFVSEVDLLMTESELKTVTKQLAQMPVSDDVLNEYEKVQIELNDLKTMDQLTRNKNTQINEVIATLEKRLLSNTVSHSIVFTENGVDMKVTVMDDNQGPNAIVAKMLLQLKSIEYFDQVDISGITSSNEEGLGAVSFTISCTYAR